MVTGRRAELKIRHRGSDFDAPPWRCPAPLAIVVDIQHNANKKDGQNNHCNWSIAR